MNTFWAAYLGGFLGNISWMIVVILAWLAWERRKNRITADRERHRASKTAL